MEAGVFLAVLEGPIGWVVFDSFVFWLLKRIQKKFVNEKDK